MNYQIPLMNLVSRGHLPVKNRIATENFIKSLDNKSCGTILENLLFNNDSRDCARQLDSLMESYQLKLNIRSNVTESTLNNARDRVLMEELEPPPLPDSNDFVSDAQKIVKLLKWGLVGGAIGFILRLPPGRMSEVMGELKIKNTKAYNYLLSQPELKKILPSDIGFFPRVADAMWTRSKKNLQVDDLVYLNKLKRFGKGVGLVAAGMVGALVAGTIAYRQLFSMEARKCKGLFGKQRTICMCNAVIAAAEDAKKKSEEMLLHCDEAKDPQDCRFKMKVEIRSWMKKIEEQQRKLAKIGSINSSPYPQTKHDPKDMIPVKIGSADDPFGSRSNDVKPEPRPVTKNIPSDPFGTDIPKKPEISDPFGSTNPFG